MGNDWLPDVHDLSGRDTVQVKFIFHSDYDEEVAEGMYIDDVTITGARMIPGSVLPPGAVSNLTVTLTADSALVLSWRPPAQGVADHYQVYRDTLYDFVPAAANSLAVTPDTAYLDQDAGITGSTTRQYYYAVKAVDGSGHKSAASERVGEFDRLLPSP
jgi:fibronectin type 3 domain-containing protein